MSDLLSCAVETHPWPPFIPDGAKVLIMGTFPPGEHRWSMNFYYPNRTNDFWFMMGLIFLGDKDALYDRDTKHFKLEKIKNLLEQKGIALSDTGYKVIRTKGNASDKFLNIVEPRSLEALLPLMPYCKAVATTGEKAAQVVAGLTDTKVPDMANYVTSPTGLEIWRMPSTSRAYPLALQKKADAYAKLFAHLAII